MIGRIILAAAPVAWVIAAPPAQAAQTYVFDIPAGRLDKALLSFATQAGISVDVSDPGLASVAVGGVRGRYTVRDGLGRLLRGTRYTFTIARGNVIKLVPRRATPLLRPKRPPQPAPPAPPPPLPSPQPIIVTASKQDIATSDFPGTIHVEGFTVEDGLRTGSLGTEVLLRELPNISSTDLGSGRNKIYVRGIADSSFNGQSLATVGRYFGESRLTYSAPDPDLALYDVRRVEVVEGPQGTLYGAGALGGVIHIVPFSPELGVNEISSMAALGMTEGRLGGEVAGIANLSLGRDAAARLVGYRIVRPGYIDDLGRGLSDINKTTVTGLRATVRVEPSERWTVDLGVLGQDTASRDGQYTDGPLPETLTRTSAIAQPFDNDYRMIFATIGGDLDFARLVSNTSFADHKFDSVFDATAPGAANPIAFEEATRVSLLTHETRLSGSSGRISSWVAGVSLAWNINHVDRLLGPVPEPAQVSATRSEAINVALFGEATINLLSDVSVTGGGRFSYVRQIDKLQAPSEDLDFEPSRTDIRLLPTAALSWKPVPGVIGYLRYQEGFRPGAQQISGSPGQATVTRFQPDEIRTFELGTRFGTQPGSRFSGGATYSFSRWNRVQADLVDLNGFPYVDNLGSAYVRFVSAYLVWKPTRQLTFESSAFITSNSLDRPAPGFEAADERDLPNIADSGWRLTSRFEPRLGYVKLTLDGTIGYIGTSYLGIGAPFDLTQGDYLDTALGARFDFGEWGLSFDIDNVANSRANRFSFGNPFSVAEGNQRTPLRPRTVRIGIDATF